VQHLAPKLFFLNDELHIILKRRNLGTGERSSFFLLLDKNIFKRTLKIRFFIDIIVVEAV